MNSPMGKTPIGGLGAEDHPRVPAIPRAQHHPGVADEGDVHLQILPDHSKGLHQGEPKPTGEVDYNYN